MTTTVRLLLESPLLESPEVQEVTEDQLLRTVLGHAVCVSTYPPKEFAREILFTKLTHEYSTIWVAQLTQNELSGECSNCGAPAKVKKIEVRAMAGSKKN